MSTYAIGDIQGCFQPFMALLEHIHFHPERDTLWFTGDLVNRGPQSLETLRYIKNLGAKHRTVLGNHDLHLLAVAHGVHSGWKEDTLDAILSAPDKLDLIEWLQHQPLLHHDLGFTLVHAGLAPSWDLAKAQLLAHEVEDVLRHSDALDFLRHMYGNEPAQWDDELHGIDRLRCVTNYFTRVRFCHTDGSMELSTKGKPEERKSLLPWFKVASRKNADLKILFGHWAALGGVTNTPNVYALDTGCVWGQRLTAMRLEDGELFCTPAIHSPLPPQHH